MYGHADLLPFFTCRSLFFSCSVGTNYHGVRDRYKESLKKSDTLKRKDSAMKRNVVLFLVGATLVWTAAYGQSRRWNEKMQGLGKTFSEILPLVAGSAPLQPAEQKKLEAAAEQLAQLAHTINMSPDTTPNLLPPEADPTLQYLSGLFDREVKYANRSLKAGQVEHARGILRKVSGYCIGCHTRHDKGPEFPTFEIDFEGKDLTPMERADLLAATRQFEGALEEYEKLVGDRNFATKRPFEWERAVRQALNVAVRVKRDPARAGALVDKVLAVDSGPQFFRSEVRAWKESIQMWQNEGKKKPATTEEQLFKEAKQLNTAARLKQQYPLDHSADILYLRASAAVHELLSLAPNGKYASEAMLIAGNAYRLLGEPLVTPLPEMYFEACVRNSPHTSLARQCYERFEESVYLAYSGSGGTFLPDDVRSLFMELKTLAQEGPEQPKP